MLTSTATVSVFEVQDATKNRGGGLPADAPGQPGLAHPPAPEARQPGCLPKRKTSHGDICQYVKTLRWRPKYPIQPESGTSGGAAPAWQSRARFNFEVPANCIAWVLARDTPKVWNLGP